jgi:hypothetical protein
MKAILFIIILVMGLTPYSVLAQQTTSQDSLLDRMVGKWTLEGTIAGSGTTHDIDVEWVLGHQYVQLKEVSHEKELNGIPSYEAMVFICWEQKLEQYSCLWLDNTGNGGLSAQAVGHAKANGDKIELLFKIADQSLFHTSFIYNRAADTWHWMMDGEENGKTEPFARVELKRKQVHP